MSTDEQLKLLIELQKLDTQIYKFRKELASMPILINGLEEEFKQKAGTLKAKEEEFTALALNRKEKEGALQAKEEGIKKLQGQLYQIKTNKEYQAMEHEIANQRADVSVLEEAILAVFDQADLCTKEIAKQKEILNQHRRNFDEEKAKVDARAKDIDVLLQKLNSDRAILVQKIEKEFLAKYDRILNSKSELVMVPVIGDACGGCNINLPPQVINEIKLKQELIFCGSCARILYIEEDNQT